MIDRVAVNVGGDTEWVEIRVHWAGGHQTYSRVRRPVAASSQLSNWQRLIDRLKELKESQHSSSEIALKLDQEGFRTAKGQSVTPGIVRVWLNRFGIDHRRNKLEITLDSGEWTIPQLVAKYELPNGTIHGWIKRGAVKSRQINGPGGRWIITASEQ